MRAFTITDQKVFTRELFTGSLFDSFLLCEADFKTSYSLHIDGRICKEYFDTEDENPQEEFADWKSLRPIAYQIIRGKRLPVYFKLVLALSSENLSNTLSASKVSLTEQDVEGMYLNIHYKDGVIFCTSGIGLNIFTMDQTLASYWDSLIARFFDQNKIEYS